MLLGLVGFGAIIAWDRAYADHLPEGGIATFSEDVSVSVPATGDVMFEGCIHPQS
ncbi:hypothetical protein [Microbacterium sp. G2-8]|uniref:hypothetical protein n=1 Tax=Microbacterium sp. G2-8 TaxID=2842454 RepID=UPI001C8B060B|nr:hypothetical protein [Microbacterium sp. G2-8]